MNKLIQLITEEEKKYVKKVVLSKGETLFYENDRCENIGIVDKGEVRIVSYQENGQEIVYNIISKGMMFGNNLIFSTEPFYRGDVVANEISEVYLINKQDLKTILKENEQFLEEYLRMQSDFGKSLNLRIKILTFNNAEDRILFLLNVNNDNLKIKSISDLAKTLNLTREATSRSLHKLEKSGVIIIEGKIIKKKK